MSTSTSYNVNKGRNIFLVSILVKRHPRPIKRLTVNFRDRQMHITFTFMTEDKTRTGRLEAGRREARRDATYNYGQRYRLAHIKSAKCPQSTIRRAITAALQDGWLSTITTTISSTSPLAHLLLLLLLLLLLPSIPSFSIPFHFLILLHSSSFSTLAG